MRYRLFAALAAVMVSFAAGCRSHMHAGGGQGFDAGASIGPRQTYFAPPLVVPSDPLVK